MADPDLALMLDSWVLHLRAQRKSEETLKAYGDGVRRFLTWCDETGHEPVLDRPTLDAFVVGLLDGGAEASTARSRQLAVRRFSAWLAEEGETDRDELLGVRPPKLDVRVVPRLTEDQIRDLIKACAGRGLRERRDEAIVRFLVETATRAGELVTMTVADVDLTNGIAVIRKGKGGKGRRVPFGPQTTRAIDRYIRLRRGHRLADTPALWLGDRGKGLGYQGLYHALAHRARMAGIPDFHPHVLRHTAAQRWLAAAGSEGGLMAVAGWTRRDMIDRYTSATAGERAAVEARGLDLGNF